jgi:hypothetical protein
MAKKRQIKLYCDIDATMCCINITKDVDTWGVEQVSTSVESVDNLAIV